jgi:hypothetical protein
MKRTWGLDVLVCPRCAGPMRLVAAVEQPAVISQILAHLGHSTQAPPRPPPWRPPQRAAATLDDADPPSLFE